MTLSKVLLFFALMLPLTAIAQFKSESDLSTVITGGNTNLRTYNADSENLYKFDKDVLELTGTYTSGESSNVQVVEIWNMGFRYERDFSEKFGVFLGELIESDRFSGLHRRYNTDLGAKYILFENDDNKIFSEVGYRYSIEKPSSGLLPENKSSKGRFFLDNAHKFNESTSVKYRIEYLNNFTDSTDYLIQQELSLQVKMNSMLSLKTAYLWRFDNLPLENNGKYDYKLTTGVLASF